MNKFTLTPKNWEKTKDRFIEYYYRKSNRICNNSYLSLTNIKSFTELLYYIFSKGEWITENKVRIKQFEALTYIQKLEILKVVTSHGATIFAFGEEGKEIIINFINNCIETNTVATYRQMEEIKPQIAWPAYHIKWAYTQILNNEGTLTDFYNAGYYRFASNAYNNEDVLKKIIKIIWPDMERSTAVKPNL